MLESAVFPSAAALLAVEAEAQLHVLGHLCHPWHPVVASAPAVSSASQGLVGVVGRARVGFQRDEAV